MAAASAATSSASLLDTSRENTVGLSDSTDATSTASTVADTGLPAGVSEDDDGEVTGTTWTRSPGARSGGYWPAFNPTATTSDPDATGAVVPTSARVKSEPATSGTATGRADHARLVAGRDHLQAGAGRDAHRLQVARRDDLARREGLGDNQHLLSAAEVQRGVGERQGTADHQQHPDHHERELATASGRPSARTGGPGTARCLAAVGPGWRGHARHRSAFVSSRQSSAC